MTLINLLTLFKGTVPRDYSHQIFFVKLLLLVPVNMPRNDFNFVRIFFELFNNFGASLVSMTPVKLAFPVSLTTVRNYSPVSTTPVSEAFAVEDGFTSVTDTAEEFLTGVNDTGEGNLTGVNDAGEALHMLLDPLFKFKIDSTFSMTMTKTPNLSGSKPVRYRTVKYSTYSVYLADTEYIRYRTYQIPNLSDKYSTYAKQISNLSYTEPIRY